jgi:hypothetical protein
MKVTFSAYVGPPIVGSLGGYFIGAGMHTYMAAIGAVMVVGSALLQLWILDRRDPNGITAMKRQLKDLQSHF